MSWRKQKSAGKRAFEPASCSGAWLILTLIASGFLTMAVFFAVGRSDGVLADVGAVTLRVPDDYRATYQFLGSWAAANDGTPGSAEIHTVYASRGTIAAFRKEGRFPDGTILVKEVHRAITGEMTTGTISHADTLRGWFVMVRDAAGAHPEDEFWGDGWGWAWFDASDPIKPSRTLPLPDGEPAATLNFRENCKPCHAPAEATDWIYVEGYPPLK